MRNDLSLQHAAERAEKEFNNVRLEGKQDRESHLRFFFMRFYNYWDPRQEWCIKMQYASATTVANYKF